MACVSPKQTTPPLYLEPTEIYHHPSYPSAPIRLVIATGGAGQSGLIRAFALAFIPEQISRGEEPFGIVWSASDTSLSFNALALRGADLSITYHPVAEEIALEQGIADRREYAWRDHWMLVGPKADPANLGSMGQEASIYKLFKQLFKAAISTAGSADPVRFLSRYDKSANNIKESAIWAAIGQTPWSIPYSQWYHQCVQLPYQALDTASRLKEYMITDRGTWLGVEERVRHDMAVFKDGTDEADDPMLNPAHILVGSRAENKTMANMFVDWLIREDGGHKVVREFASRDGTVLYSPAPLASKAQSRL